MPNLRSSIVAALVLAAPVYSVAAQVQPLPAERPAPVAWVSASGALLDLQSFYGGAGGEAWNWGNGVQLRGTLERPIRRDMTVGVAGSFARIPLTIGGGSCSGCEGKGTAWTAMGVLRLGGGGGVGFHNVLEASAGVAGFTNFSSGRGALDPTGPITSAHRSIVPAVAVSYGVGYTLNPGLEISFAQEIGLFIHGNPDAAPGNATSTPQFRATRLTLRYAIGQ